MQSHNTKVDSPKIKKPRTTSLDIEIGQRLQKFREMFNITQIELGDAIGVTFQQIQKYEKGVNRVHAEVLWRIAYTFGINISFFFPTEKINTDNKINFDIQDIKYDDKQSLNFIKSYLEIKDDNVKKRIFNLVSSVVEAQDE